MTIPTSGKPARKLPYPLYFAESDSGAENVGDITIVSPDFFPPDDDEKINVVFNLSLNDFIALASSIDVGRDIAYGEFSDNVWRMWCKALLGTIMVNCEDIADCIDTSEAVQDAIATNQNIILQNAMNIANSGIGDIPAIDAATSTINNTPFAAGSTGIVDEPIKELENCDLNALWAGIRDGIVSRLDDNARSMLEFLVTKADLAERATALIGAIPIFGSMAQAVLDQMVEAAPDMLNLFSSYSSIENMDTIACEIFGIVCAECRYPTMEEVYSYYATFGITGMNDLENIVISAATDLLFGSTELAALAFYHTMISYQLFILLLGSKFHGATGSQAIVRMATLGEDFANDNWTILCDDCNEPYAIWEWNFATQGQGESYVDSAITTVTNKPVFIAGKGWMLVNHSTGRRADIAFPLNPSWEFRAVGFNTVGAALAARQIALRSNPGNTSGQIVLSIAGGTGDYNHVSNGLLSTTLKNEVAFFAQIGNQTDTVYIDKIAFVFNFGTAKDPSTPTNDPTL